MDIEKFKSQLKGSRIHHIIDLAVSPKRGKWFEYDWLVERSVRKAREEKTAKTGKRSFGTPRYTHRNIRFLIKIGFLLADPDRGLKVNENFKPYLEH